MIKNPLHITKNKLVIKFIIIYIKCPSESLRLHDFWV